MSPSMIVVGIGSRLRQDDMLGPVVIDRLQERIGSGALPRIPIIELIDADTMPENFTRPICRSGAQLCLLVDIAEMRLVPGAIRLIPAHCVDTAIPSAHSLPLSLIMHYIGESLPRVELLGVQREITGLGEEMSPACTKAVDEVVSIILEGRIDEVERYSPSAAKQ